MSLPLDGPRHEVFDATKPAGVLDEMPATPPAWRVFRLLAGASVRRMWNRIRNNVSKSMNRRRRGEAPAPVKRTGTGRKHGLSLVLMLFLGGLFIFNGFNLSSMIMLRLAGSVDRASAPAGQVPVGAEGWHYIVKVRENLDSAKYSESEKHDYLLNARRGMMQAFQIDATTSGKRSEAAHRVEEQMQQYDAHGVDGFRRGLVDNGLPYPRRELWVGPALIPPLGTLLALMVVTLTMMVLGTGNQDLGKVEWSMEWLFTFPVSARTLFAARVAEFAIANPINWFIAFPLTSVIYICGGYGWYSPLLGLAGMLYIGIMIGSLRLAVETLLRIHLSFNKVKSCQAGFTLVSLVAFFCVVGAGSVPGIADFIVAHAPPAAAMFNPFSAPVLLNGEGSLPWIGALLMAVSAVLVPLVAVNFSHWQVRNGLLSNSGSYSGVRPARGHSAAPKSLDFDDSHARKGLLRGAARKDLLLLLRDRNFLVQTMLLPLLIVGFNLMVNPDLVASVTAHFRHGAALAFGLGAYVLMFSAFNVLAVEGPGLWMLFTFPKSIERVLLQKVTLWMLFAGFYTLVALIICASLQPRLDITAVADAVMALSGIGIYAFIAAGIGVLATDPQEVEAQRKLRPEMLYLYMLLSAMFMYAIYTPSAWGKMAQLVLCGGLAFALWQKVRDLAPYMLDPTEEPPPRIGLSDGLIAVLAFFVLQGLIMLLLVSTKAPIPPGAMLVAGFVGAGFLVATFTMYIFWRSKVPHLLASLGYRRGPNGEGSWLGALAWGIAGGLATGCVAIAYGWAVENVEFLKLLKDESMPMLQGQESIRWWFAGLAVIAAPLFEEYIFRALVYRGLRRSMTPLLSILLSAGIFAIVHPPISFIPVFIMGAVAAFTFERSRLLLAPMVTHMVYNGIVVAVSFSAAP